MGENVRARVDQRANEVSTRESRTGTSLLQVPLDPFVAPHLLIVLPARTPRRVL